MTIYFDFDGTIFNTNKMYNDFVKIFKKYKITKDDINNILIGTIPKGEFHLERLTNEIVNKYGLDLNKVLKEVKKLYLNDYVYPDVLEYIKLLKKDYHLVLLTCGNYEYQKIKIKMSKLEKYFEDVIISKKKYEVSKVDYKHGIFIDNTPKMLKNFEISGASTLIRMKRIGDNHYSDIDEDNYFTVSKFNKKMYDYIISSDIID